MQIRRYLVVAVLACTFVAATLADDVTVRNSGELRAAVKAASPGTRILLAPGDYPGGFYFAHLRGEVNRRIVIAAEDPSRPPIIKGGKTGIHLSDAAHIELHHLIIADWTGNGLSVES